MHLDNRSALLFAILTAAFLGASLLAAHQAQAGKPAVFTGIIKGVAVGGYDPVAYFTQGAAQKGSKDITAGHGGAVRRFSSEANRAAFLSAPEK